MNQKRANAGVGPLSRLVVFDLGRVLVRICDSWRHACEVVGIEIAGDWTVLDAPAQARLTSVIHDFDTGRIDLSTFATQAAPFRGLTPDQVIAISDGFLLGPYPGAGELLDDLHTAGHATACLSNTNANHWRRLIDRTDEHGLVLSRLHHRFASHLLGIRKPDPSIYEHVERNTGAIPSRIIFFDDMAENIAAAQQRGWSAHLVELGQNPIPAIRQRLAEEGVL
jgi:HAD superfamily hydrolase (TIGR01509 family)